MGAVTRSPVLAVMRCGDSPEPVRLGDSLGVRSSGGLPQGSPPGDPPPGDPERRGDSPERPCPWPRGFLRQRGFPGPRGFPDLSPCERVAWSQIVDNVPNFLD